MKIFEKKLEEMLEASPSYGELREQIRVLNDYSASVAKYLLALEDRVKALEGNVAMLASTTRSLMETCTQLVRGHSYNRKAIEEILAFISSPEDPMLLEHEPGLPDAVEGEPEMTPEQLAEYKKSLN